MSELKKRLIGKKIKMVQSSIDDWGVIFSDGSGISVNTKVEANLNSDIGEMVVTDVCTTDRVIDIRLGEASSIKISLDENLLDGPEFFVFQDLDGTYIVGN